MLATQKDRNAIKSDGTVVAKATMTSGTEKEIWAEKSGISSISARRVLVWNEEGDNRSSRGEDMLLIYTMFVPRRHLGLGSGVEAMNAECKSYATLRYWSSLRCQGPQEHCRGLSLRRCAIGSQPWLLLMSLLINTLLTAKKQLPLSTKMGQKGLTAKKRKKLTQSGLVFHVV